MSLMQRITTFLRSPKGQQLVDRGRREHGQAGHPAEAARGLAAKFSNAPLTASTAVPPLPPPGDPVTDTRARRRPDLPPPPPQPSVGRCRPAPRDAPEAPPASSGTGCGTTRSTPRSTSPWRRSAGSARRRAQWAARARAEQPGRHRRRALPTRRRASSSTCARLSGAVSGAAGLPGAVIDVGVLAWTQARMVLHIAAAYGVDPRHADRATDLLVLQKVHKVAETARLALGVAAGRERAGALLRRRRPAPARPGHAQARRASWPRWPASGPPSGSSPRSIPGAAIILGTWANSSATKDLARRIPGAVRLPGRRRPGAPPPLTAGQPASRRRSPAGRQPGQSARPDGAPGRRRQPAPGRRRWGGTSPAG